MSVQTILRTVEFKLYPTPTQERTLTDWLERCCWLYNRCLEHRIKAYERRGENVKYNAQTVMLTGLRARMPLIAEVPVEFARSALRRIDRGFQAFFRRCKSGEKPGFPRYRSRHRFNSLECLDAGWRGYIFDGELHVPKLGTVKYRAGDQDTSGKQKLLRIIRRASGWYGQMVLDTGIVPPEPPAPDAIASPIGIDVGLTTFAALSQGDPVENPRLLAASQLKVRHAHRKVSRRIKGSCNRRKAIKRLARVHERVAAQRKDFLHQESRKLVNRFDLIGFEALNIKGLCGGMLAKPIHDAAWGMFLFFVTYKAANAGRHAVPVDARGTSQECPFCGAIQHKSLSERRHECACGASLDRDFASSLVIETRAVRVVAASACGVLASMPGIEPGVSRDRETGSPIRTLPEENPCLLANGRGIG